MKSQTIITQRLIRGALTAGALSVSVLLLDAAPAIAQQPGGQGGTAAGQRALRGPQPIDFEDHVGWTNILDGTPENYANWDGDPDVWHLDAENHLIWAESTCENPVGSTYMYWKGGQPANFDLKVEMKVEPNINSGLQYRSFLVPPDTGAAQNGGNQGGQAQADRPPCPSGQPRGVAISSQPGHGMWHVGGDQFDFNYSNSYTGQYYEGATGRGIIAFRGDVVRTEPDTNPRLISSVGDFDELSGYVKLDDWNQVEIIARGNIIIHILNGHVMSMLVDDEPDVFRDMGLIALQIEGTGKVSYRNMWLKEY